ncbi:MAG: hypothetical protein HFE73_07070 [Firmicutes bacterium]|nr:hypothetical protein [Bacillota bacterium]
MSIKDTLNYILHYPERFFRKRMKDREYMEYVCQASGWTMEETKAAMKKAKAEGISYKYYAKKRLWTRTEKQMAQVQKNAAAARARNEEATEHAIAVVMEKTGMSRLGAEEKMREARKLTGSSYKDYYRFHFYELSPEEQQTYFTLGTFEALSFKYNSNPQAIQTLLKKDRFAEKFDDLFHRVWFLNRNLSFDEFSAKCRAAGLSQLILKPLSSTQGKGIVRIEFSDYPDLKAVYDEIMSMKRMLCEECIVQHEAIAAFNQSSVNTVRVLTIVDKGICHHVYAGFRMGRGALVDNFHAGGIIASVDTKTGITCMDAIDLDGNHYPVHPTSGLPTLGFQLPNWPEVLKLTKEAALRMAENGAAMVGWDVAITRDGVCLVEGNSEPSHSIIQLPYVDSHIGMKKLVEPFLS